MLSKTVLMATAAFLGLTVAQSNIHPTYNCDTFKSECSADATKVGLDPSTCNDRYEDCLSCTTLEHSCQVGANNAYGALLKCTSEAEKCYNLAVSGGTTNGYYGCKQAFTSCSGGPMANHSLCASQDAACKSCQTKENECRNKPGANQSFCSSQAGTCFANAVTSDGAL